jgi:hypothetical protein
MESSLPSERWKKTLVQLQKGTKGLSIFSLVPIANEFQRAGLLVFMPIESLAISGGWRNLSWILCYVSADMGRKNGSYSNMLYIPAGSKSPKFQSFNVKNTGYPLRNHFSKW